MSAYTVSCLAQDARVMQVKGDPARHRARPTPEPYDATQYPPEPVLPFSYNRSADGVQCAARQLHRTMSAGARRGKCFFTDKESSYVGLHGQL